jgi:hypothetical protein
MKITTPSGTIVVTNSSQDRVWYFRTYPFKVVWYTEWSLGKQESKRFALASELSKFMLDKWGENVAGVFLNAKALNLPTS